MIKNEVGRIDPTQEYHNRVLEAVIEQVLKEMYADLYKINPLLIDNFTQTFGATTPIAISKENTSGIYYSTLPSPIVNIPAKGLGVRHIYPIVQTGNVFVPIDAREADLIYSTDVPTVTSKIGFRTRQDTRVDYYHMATAIIATGVRMDLLIPFSEYADTDVVNIPELGKKEGGTFVERVMEALQTIPPSDLDDDNAPQETQQKTK